MDDLLKGLAFGFFAFTIFRGSLERRVEHNAAKQVREAFHYTGTVRADAHPRGLLGLGLYANDYSAMDIYGNGLKSDRLPFYVYQRGGWKGRIRHLRLHFTDLTLAGLRVDKFEANVPFVTYDLGHALYKGRLHFRGAGMGPARVDVSANNLRSFIIKKFDKTLSDVEVWTQNKKVYLSGRLSLLGAPLPFLASGTLKPREGRFLDISEPAMSLSGLPLSPRSVASILKQINPIVDAVKDLGLGDFFTITDVEIGDIFVTIHGRVTVPPAEAKPQMHTDERR